MSRIINKLASMFKIARHEFSESASRRSGRGVGDSARTTFSDHQTTNKQATSTFTGLMMAPVAVLAVLGLGGVFGTQDTYATASSLSISISGNPTINIPPTASGKFSDSGNITVTVNTTHAAGYGLSLTATGSSNPTSLATNNGAGTVGFETLAAGTKIDADTFAATANTQYNGKWGYRYNKTGSTTSDDDKYRPSPSTSGDTLDTTNTNADNTYQLSIGARATTDTAMDDYSNTFRFVVLANATPYTLTYVDNSGEATGMPANITDGESAAEGITLSSTEPSRDGYTFEGWCTVSTSDDSCSGTTYAAGDTYNLDLTAATNNITLYAMWKSAGVGTCASGGVPGYICYDGNGAEAGEMANQQASASASVMLQAYNYKRSGYGFLGWSTVKNPTIGTDTIYGPMEHITTPSTMATTGLTLYAVWLPKDTSETMQSFTTSDCSSKLTKINYNSSGATFTVTSNSFIALEDERDHDVYTVARMADGFCWMLENLRLNESATGINTAAKSQGGASFTISQLPASTNSFTTSSYTSIQYNKNNTDIDNNNLTASYDANNATSKWYGYGNYYSWAAARGTTSALSSGNTSTSLCPANWRMPIGNNSTANYSFGKLSTSMGGLSSNMSSSSSPTGEVMSKRLRQFPNNFVYSGYWDSSSAYARSTYGYYWSSTASDSGYAYSLYFYSSTVYPGTSNSNKYYGLSVRCVLGS